MLIRFFAAALLFSFSITAFSQTAPTLYEEGVKLKNDKKSAEAISKFQQALLKDPSNKEARYEMAWCMNDTKNYSQAIQNLKIVRQQWPEASKVYFELGYAFEKSGMTDSAIASYNKCLSLKSDYSLAYKQLGYIEYDKNNYSAALERLKKFADLKNGVVDDYIYWYRVGFMHNAQKEYEKAIEALQKSEGLKKDYLNTYLELGFSNTKLKKNEEAIAWFNKAKAINPKDHVAYNGIAEIYRDNLKDYNKAIELYKETLNIKPRERKACFGIGYSLNSTSKYSEAIPYLRTAIEEESTYAAAYVELGYSLYRTGNNSEAKTNLNKALSLNNQNANARYYLGLVYITEKNRTMAQQMADELKKLNSANAESLQKRVDAM